MRLFDAYANPYTFIAHGHDIKHISTIILFVESDLGFVCKFEVACSHIRQVVGVRDYMRRVLYIRTSMGLTDFAYLDIYV